MGRLLTEVTKNEREAVRNGRMLERLYQSIKNLTSDMINFRSNLRGAGDAIRLESSKTNFENVYNQIVKIENKYFNSHIELAKKKEEYERYHKDACYFCARRFGNWGEE